MLDATEKEKLNAKLVEYFGNKPEIDAAILFGSLAKGSFNEHSDIDIAVYQYDTLDNKIFFDIINNHLVDFSDFAASIAKA